MPDFKFSFIKQTEIIIEAESEHEAWVKVSHLNPETLGAEWEINMGALPAPKEIPLDEGPVEVDDWDQFNSF